MALLDLAGEGGCDLVAAFGGQGILGYFDELRSLHEESVQIVHRVCRELSGLAQEWWKPDLDNPVDILDLLDDLASPLTREELMAPPLSCPLIALCQLATFWKHCGPNVSQFVSRCSAVVGHSQGLASALLAAACDDDNFEELCMDLCTYLFFQGLRCQEAWSRLGGDLTESAMMSVISLLPQLRESLQSTSGLVSLACINASTRHVLCGNQADLQDFAREHQLKHKLLDIAVPFHSSRLEEAVDAVMVDVERLDLLRWLRPDSLKARVPATDTGDDLRGAEADGFIRRVVEMQLVAPNDWPQCLGCVLGAARQRLGNRRGEEDIKVTYVLDMGPSGGDGIRGLNSFTQFLTSDLPVLVATAGSRVSTDGRVGATILRERDRAALPVPYVCQSPAAREDDAPTDALEAALLKIFRQFAPNISMHARFLASGIDSLAIVRVVPSVVQLLPEITVADILQAGSIVKTAELGRAKMMGLEPVLPVLPPVEDQIILTCEVGLTLQQEQMWALYQLDPTSARYNEARLYSVADLDVKRLEVALEQLGRRHGQLQSSFCLDEQGIPMQRVLSEFPVRILEVCAGQRSTAEAMGMAHAAALRPFRLEVGEVWRVLCVEAESGWLMLLAMHHIVMDGWSLPIILRDLAQLYTGQRQRRGATLPTPTFNYHMFALWQQEMRQGPWVPHHIERWQKVLGGVPKLELPLDFPRPRNPTHAGDVVKLESLGSDTSRRLREVGIDDGASAFVVLLAAWFWALSRFCRQGDVTVGVPYAGRDAPQLHSVVGYFVNVLPVHVDLEKEASFRDALLQTKYAVLEAISLGGVPFMVVVPELGPESAADFRSLFVLREDEMKPVPWEAGTELQPIDMPVLGAKSDLVLVLREAATSDSYEGRIEFSSECFTPSTVQRLSRAYSAALGHVAATGLDMPLDVRFATDEEAGLQAQWSAPDSDVVAWSEGAGIDASSTIDVAVFAHGDSRPDGMAVVAPDARLTWAELVLGARRVSFVVREQVHGTGGLIGIMIEPSKWMAVATLGVWHAGHGYMPMDPGQPVDRLQFIVDDSDMRLLLCMQKFHGTAAQVCKTTSVLEETELSQAHGGESDATMGSIAYAIYTSGSTGKPKGVPITHRAAFTHVAFSASVFRFEATDIGVQSASFMFDAHVLELWPLLYSGTQCVIAKKDITKDLDSFSGLLEEHRCSWTFFVPSVLTEILNNFKLPDTLRTIVVGGEATSTQLCSRILAHGVELINMYGPTEVAVASTFLSITSMAEVPELCMALPIGRPCAWRECWILDTLQHLSFSRIGELHISGEGMSAGYFNLPQKNAATFVPTPAHLSTSSSRLYKSGDLVRWLPTGHIEFLGRLDFQVKLRGLRIELGEIENIIRQVPLVAEALVLVRSDHLVGYYSGAATQEAVLAQCRNMLPGYMVPTAVVHLATWPRGRTGKIDRFALPEPVFADEGGEDVPARNDFEAQLLGCFCSVLQVKKLNVTRSFFDAGGTSLKAASLLAIVRKQMQANITFGDFYANPSVRQLAAFLCSGRDNTTRLPPMKNFEGWAWESEVPCSFGQEQMLALFEVAPKSPAYNCPTLLQIDGPLDVLTLSKAMKHIVKSHDAWRANLDRNIDDNPVQYVYSPDDFECPIHYWDGHQLRSLSHPDRCKLRHRAPRPRNRTGSNCDASRMVSLPSQASWTWSPVSSRSRTMSGFTGMGGASPRSPGASPRTPLPQRSRSRIGSRLRQSGIFQEGISDFFRPQHPPGKSFEALHAWLKHEMVKPFDVRGEPLIRVVLAWVQKNKYLLLFNMHHAIFDGTSLGIFSRELCEAYKAFLENDAPPGVGKAPFDFVDYSTWQRHIPTTDLYAEQCNFWRRELEGAARLQLPTDGIDPQSPEGADSGDVAIVVSAKVTHHLRTIAKENGTTMYTVLLAIYAVLLGRYSGSTDVLLGSAWSGRDGSETSPMIGYFVNTLLLRVPLRPCGFTELLATCHDVVMRAFSNAVVPYVEVLKACGFTQNMVVADFAFADESWTEAGVEQQFQLANVRVKVLEVMSISKAKFDLSLEIAETTSGELSGKLSYNAAVFKQDRIKRMAEHLQTLIECFVEHPQHDVLQAPLLSGAQLETVSKWSQGERLTGIDFDNNRLITDLFLQQVKKTPRGVALVTFEGELTYTMLDSRAEHLGQKLLALGVGPEVMVGLLQKRSVNLVASLWAVLKAGGAYVPIDPDYPPDRVAHILEDTSPPVLMTSQDLFSKLDSDVGTRPMFVQDEMADWQAGAPRADRICSSATPDSLAYVVFSSGSTGKPKGSLVEHRMLVNETLNQIRWMALGLKDRVLQFHNPAFDGSIPELVSVLCSGAALVLWTDNFADAIAQLRVNKLTMTPSALSILDDTVKLKVLGTGAEALPLSLAQAWASKTVMWNFYGPSECTVDATATRVSPDATVIHIGKPIPNCQAYILSPELVRQPQGVPGELCIAGVQVARGYLKREELTKEKFIQDPFGPGRMYRTGDVVQWMPDGNIEFRGRSDFQVKVRGFRVELGEIEVALQQNGCRTSVTMVEDQQIVAFVTPQNLDTDALKLKLSKQLPPYFVPSVILCFEELPRTPNGKFDREALKRILASSIQEVKTTEIVPPRNGVENRIVELVKEVLKLKALSIRESLKLAGMTSLHSMRLVTKLRAINIDVSLQDLYQIQCIEDLTDSLQKQRAASSFAVSEEMEDLGTERGHRRRCMRQACSTLCQCVLTVVRFITMMVLVVLIAAVMMYPAVPPVYLIFKLGLPLSPVATVVLVGVVGWPMYVLGLMVTVTLFKWLVVGRYRRGSVHIDSFQYLRWWAVDRVVAFANDYCLSTIRGGTCYYVFLKLLGVRTKGFCFIETAFVSEFDLVELGAGCVICNGARLRPAVIEDGVLTLRHVCLGAGVCVGEGSVVLCGGTAEDGAHLQPLSLLSGRDQRLPRGSEWHGSPLQPVSRLQVRGTPAFRGVCAKLLKFLVADLVALALVGIVLVGASMVFYASFGVCMRAFVITSWTWWEDAIGFELSAVAFVFGPLISPYCDLTVGTDALVGTDGDHGTQRILRDGLLLRTFVALVIAYTVMGVAIGVLSVFCARALGASALSRCGGGRGEVPLLSGTGELRRHLVSVLLRTAWGRFLMFYNGTQAMPVWLRLLGARCGSGTVVALTDLSDPSGVSIGSGCVLNQVSLAGTSPRLSSDGVWVRQLDAIQVGDDCFLNGGLMLPSARVDRGTIVQGSAIQGHIQSSAVYGTPPVLTKRTEFDTDLPHLRDGKVSRIMLSCCHKLYPILLPAMMNLAMLFALVPALLFITWLTTLAHVDADHYWLGILLLPLLYLSFGVCVGVVAVPLKWLILFRDGDDSGRLPFWPWYPYLRLKYYRHLLAQWIHMMALATFMNFTQGTSLYSFWLKLHGVGVAIDAKIFTALCDFDLITIGSNTVVGRDAQLSGRRVLPCTDGGFVESKTRVIIGPRCTLGEVSSVTCAEVKEMSVVGALTGIGPDMQLPSRSLAIGAPPWRFAWERYAVRQADQSELMAPQLDADVVLPPELLSELNKSLRRGKSKAEPCSGVLVTGAAGFLGRYVVHALLQIPDVSVFIVLRGRGEKTPQQRFAEAMHAANLHLGEAADRVQIYNGDIGESKFGLNPQMYADLCDSVAHVYHVASRVNHAEPYERLKHDNVQGTLNMLEFAATRRLKNFHYVSTIGTISPEMADSRGRYPEEPNLGHIRMGNLVGSCEITGGYAYSKWVAEKIVNEAFSRHLPGSIWRPGIIGGCSWDGYSGDDNFVHLMKDMVTIGEAPRLLGSQFNITPVDFVAHALAGLVSMPALAWCRQTFHPIAQGSDLDMVVIREELVNAGYPLAWVPFHAFRDKVKARFAGAVDSTNSAAEFKSWLLVGALSSEGQCLDATARTDRAWAFMQSARNADTWSPRDLTRRMIAHLVGIRKFPPPPSACVPVRPAEDAAETMKEPLMMANGQD